MSLWAWGGDGGGCNTTLSLSPPLCPSWGYISPALTLSFRARNPLLATLPLGTESLRWCDPHGSQCGCFLPPPPSVKIPEKQSPASERMSHEKLGDPSLHTPIPHSRINSLLRTPSVNHSTLQSAGEGGGDLKKEQGPQSWVIPS